MDSISIIRAIIALFEWLGVKIAPYDALLLVGLSFVGFVAVMLAKFNTRLNMHADHFDVLDDTHTESLKQSSKALENSAYAKGAVDTIIKAIKK